MYRLNPILHPIRFVPPQLLSNLQNDLMELREATLQLLERLFTRRPFCLPLGPAAARLALRARGHTSGGGEEERGGEEGLEEREEGRPGIGHGTPAGSAGHSGSYGGSYGGGQEVQASGEGAWVARRVRVDASGQVPGLGGFAGFTSWEPQWLGLHVSPPMALRDGWDALFLSGTRFMLSHH